MGAKCSTVEKGVDEKAAPLVGRCSEVWSTGAPVQSIRTSASALKRNNSWKKNGGRDFASSGRTSASFRPMRIDSERASRNLQALQRLAFEVVGQLNHFQVFVNTSCAKPSDAFEWLAGDRNAKEISFDKFTQNLKKYRFTGQSDIVFYGLCEDPKRLQNGSEGLIIARGRFIKRIVSMGNPFRLVVHQVMARHKRRDIQATDQETKQDRKNEATGCHRVNAETDPSMKCTAKASKPTVKPGSSSDSIADNPQDGNSQDRFEAPQQ